MVRPKAPQLTERELEIMQIFWDIDGGTATDVRERLAARGRDLAYTTVATLIRILTEKRFLRQTKQDRPFTYEAERSFDEVSVNLVDDLVKRVFRGSKEKLLVSLFGQQEQLSDRDRELLEDFLREQNQ